MTSFKHHDSSGEALVPKIFRPSDKSFFDATSSTKYIIDIQYIYNRYSIYICI
jgi:hypothetical protein